MPERPSCQSNDLDPTLFDFIGEICEKLIVTKSSISITKFASSLQALEVQYDLFSKSLRNIVFDEKLTAKERQVTQAAAFGLYNDDDIECTFYKHGGYTGIIALILIFRNSEDINKWCTMKKEFQVWLVKRVCLMLDDRIVSWIPKYIESIRDLPPQIRYLGKHAGRRLKRNQASSVTSHPSRPSCEVETGTSPSHRTSELPNQFSTDPNSNLSKELTATISQYTNKRQKPLQGPSQEVRQMKDTYSAAPFEYISKFPEPFRTAVQNSKQWKWERSQSQKTTGCWSIYFPKEDRQDVSLTIWCGHNDGYYLANLLGTERVFSTS